MSPLARRVAIATIAGLLAASVAILAGAWLADAVDDGPPPDGEFVLDQPGEFLEPSEAVNADRTGDELPDRSLTDVDGVAVSLTRYRGSPLIVNFWFSRCAPCRRELRDVAAAHAEFGDTVQFVGVDPFDTVGAMQRFADERGVDYDLLRDAGDLSNALGIVGYPVTLFVDAEGRILRQTGEVTLADLRAGIDELF